MEAVRAAIAELEQREQHVRAQERALASQQATVAAECEAMKAEAQAGVAKQLAELQARNDDFMAEQEKVREEVLKLKGRVDHDTAAVRQHVKLNVGGCKFETTASTLTKYENTYFSAAFSGRHEVRLDDDGYYFIDRDGKHFGAILNFLRTGKVRVPSCAEDAEDFMDEVEFYMLTDAVLDASGRVASARGRGKVAADYTRQQVWDLRQRGIKFFSGCKFDGLDLSYINFEDCELTGASFKGANLTRATFGGPGTSADSLEGTSYSRGPAKYANLNDASFEDAILTCTRFDYAQIKNAVFDRATLDRTSFEHCRVCDMVNRSGNCYVLDETTLIAVKRPQHVNGLGQAWHIIDPRSLGMPFDWSLGMPAAVLSTSVTHATPNSRWL